MSREIIQEALNGIRDEYITEAGARLGLLAATTAAVGAAAVGATGAAVDPSTLYSLSGTEAAVKTGFGAWLAKGGWVALVAGVVVAAGVAAGAFLLGKGGDVPPVGSGDVTTEDTEQGTSEDTDEETADGTEEDTQGGIHDETTGEDTAVPHEPRRLQFPLTSADDTAGYVLLPDLTDEKGGFLEFFIVPTDTDIPEPTSVFRLLLRADGETNMQVIRYQNEKSYGFIFMQESSYVEDVEGVETRHVQMQCSRMGFVPDKTFVTPASRYYWMDGGDMVSFGYADINRQSMLARYKATNQVALERTKKLIQQYNDPEKYEYTILYSYIDGVETINTPVEEMPSFDFPIFNEYGFDN